MPFCLPNCSNVSFSNTKKKQHMSRVDHFERTMQLSSFFWFAILTTNGELFGNRPLLQLQQKARDKLKDICTTTSCKRISLSAASRREAVRQHLIEFNSKQRATGGLDVDRHLNLIFEAKKAVLSQNGLQDIIEPHDDGLFGGDLLLNEQQAQWIIEQSKKQNVSAERRKLRAKQRASALALDSFPGSHWPSTTVNYFIGPRFNNNQTSTIIQALTMLTEGTCFKFVRVSKPVRPVLRFAPIVDADPGLCGYAYVGYQDSMSNVVNINFKSKLCAPGIKAVIAHETMHVFGFMHEHTRFDRDNFITVNWSNVDPQSMDIFTKDDPEQVNPYCVEYNYQSIMHYDSYVGAKDYSYPSFWAKVRPRYHLMRLGNYPKPSRRDILTINKLYCLSDESCQDETSSCGFMCGNCTTSASYRSKCKRSCDVCTFRTN